MERAGLLDMFTHKHHTCIVSQKLLGDLRELNYSGHIQEIAGQVGLQPILFICISAESNCLSQFVESRLKSSAHGLHS